MVKNLIKAALGETEPDLILKNGTVYDVFTGDMRVADVAVKDGIICGVGSYSGENEHDIAGKYVLPGFIDAHMHIESSMVTPAEYARVAMPRGVTTVIADPHEITNVCGEDGLAFMKKSAATVPLGVEFMLPSCVPATPFEHSGAVLTAADTARLAPEFRGIAEMMNYPGILSCDEETLGKLISGKPIDGHAPLLDGHGLDAYVSAGITTDHECSLPSEVKEKVSKGMMIMLREGTLSKDIEKLAPAVDTRTARRCMFCTDDRFAGEILREGSIDHCIRRAVECGIDPRDAVNMATINAAEHYGIHTGAIAPSYRADIVVCDALVPTEIYEVYKDGVLAAKDGEAVFTAIEAAADTSAVTDTVHIEPVTAEFFAHEPNLGADETFTAIELVPRAIITKKVTAKRGDKLAKVCVIERHKNTGHKGFGYVTNFGITNGAIASSIGHDSHNVIVIGSGDADMALAVNTLGKSGGIAVCANGKVKEYLPLEIAGLMSNKTAAEVVEIHDRLEAAAREIGVTDGIDPFLSLAFLPLPVIPEIRVTDSGTFDVEKFEFIG